MIDEWFVKSRFFKNPNIRSSLWHLVFFTKSMFWRRLITMMICIGVFLTLLETHRGILLYVAYLNSSLIQGIWNIGTYLFIFVLPLYSTCNPWRIFCLYNLYEFLSRLPYSWSEKGQTQSKIPVVSYHNVL